MKFKQIFKKLALFIIGVFILLTGFACKAKQAKKVPYGDLGEKVVLKATYDGKDFTINEKQLYDLFRNKSYDVLKKLIDKEALKDYLAKIDLTNEEHKQLLVDELNTTVFGEKDVEKLKLQSSHQLYTRFVSFKNAKSYLSDYPIGKLEEKVIAELDKANPQERDFTNYEADLLSIGHNKLAKRLLAYEYLTNPVNGKDKNQALIDIEKDPNYIDPKGSAFLTKFKDNHAYVYDINYFAVDFINQEEFDLANAKLANPVKYSTNGTFYLIPDIRKDKATSLIDLTEAQVFKDGAPNEKKDNFNEDYEWTYLYKLIQKQLIDAKLVRPEIKKPEDLIGNITLKEYQTYISKYEPRNEEGIKRHKDTIIKIEGDETEYRVIDYFVDLYNIVHGKSLKAEGAIVAGDNPSCSIVIKDGAKDFKTRFTYEEMKNSSLKDFLYKDLKFTHTKVGSGETEKSVIDYTKNTNFSSKLSSKFGDRYFFAYKIHEYRYKEDGVENRADIFDYQNLKFRTHNEGDDASKFLPPALYQLLRNEIIQDKASDSLGNTRFNELLKEKKFQIFDPLQRISFDQGSVSYDSKKLFLDDNAVARVGEDTTISVRKFYEEMFHVFGISLAISNLSEQIIWEKYKDKLTAERKNELKKSLEIQVSNFGQGADQSYNPSIGRDLYLQHKYGYKTMDEVLVHRFYADDVKRLFSKDMPSLIPDYANKLTTFANSYYDRKFSVEVSHILFSVDLNQDGTPDNPNSPEVKKEHTEILNAIRNIWTHLQEVAAKGSGSKIENFKKAVELYNSATRIQKTNEDFKSAQDYADYKETAAFVFALSKRGISINLKLEESMNLNETSFNQYDRVFHNRTNKLYTKLVAANTQDKDLPIFDWNDFDLSDDSVVNNEFMSNFGWHNIIVTKITKQKSAAMKKDYTSEMKDENGNAITCPKNTNEKVSLEQVQTYLKERTTDQGVKIDSSTDSMENTGSIGLQISAIDSKVTVYGDLGNLVILKEYQFAAPKESVKTKLEEFKQQTINTINGNSKYSKEYQTLWATPDGTANIVKYFGFAD